MRAACRLASAARALLACLGARALANLQVKPCGLAWLGACLLLWWLQLGASRLEA